ncbi:pentatricopeptide repeat-containing protein At3g12770 [Ricinus communis]|uniref:pentatricopeptide repeat-containing protein At3g12770 n=1 Tax=Ricinus communis TaxID=3988 RepID=UPI00201A40EC|nr:pentatricopeptide repeat-containing protein At3g12770 [Ricinus communis]
MIILSAIKAFAPITSRYYHSVTLLSPFQNLLNLLELSITNNCLTLTQQCHAQIFSMDFSQNPFIATKLISAYAICGVPTASKLVFNSLEVKSVPLWNSLISGYVKNQENTESFSLFCQMCSFGVLPDDYTLATLSKVCGEIGHLIAGKIIHGLSLKIGFVLDTVVANSLMSMYCKCGEFSEALKLFDEMPERSVGSWNVVIAGYSDSGDRNLNQQIVDLVKDMQIDGFKPNAFTVSSLLVLCDGDIEKLDYGRELHGFIVRNELDLGCLGSDVHLGSCLIDMYSRINRVEKCMQLFDQMKRRNVYVWTAMINGYVQNGALEEALTLFHEMQAKDGVEPNRVTLVSVLPICSSLAGLPGGKQIHGYAIRKRLNFDASLSNALIDMYSKCGSLNYARRVFDNGTFRRDAISWSSIISGYGLHGKGEEAVFLYDKMLQLGNKPDQITVIGVISACGRSGLVYEGLRIYNSAISEYGIKPTIEICACFVDMLGRSGHLGLALEFIGRMPIEPGPSVWGALVSASIMHGNLEMQDLAYGFLIQSEPENPSNYVSLSNLHASSRRWDNVAEVRTIMKERGLRKTPGCSWININNRTHCFYAADKVHPRSNSIYELLDGLILLMKGTTHSPVVQNAISY